VASDRQQHTLKRTFIAPYFPRLVEASKKYASNIGVFLGFITLIPFISLGYVTFLYLFSLTGVEFFATKNEVALLLQPSNIVFFGSFPAAIIFYCVYYCDYAKFQIDPGID